MIPQSFITAWRAKVPWLDDKQVEQDLVICRALIEIFSDSKLNNILAFRGGTALHKLFFTEPLRYSEDIDLVQTVNESHGPLITAIRTRLDKWLGKPKRKIKERGVTLIYRFDSEISPSVNMRLKIEINTRESFSVEGYRKINFEVVNPWFSGVTDINTYSIEEILGTKLRALYQRKKGRDLFDLCMALKNIHNLNTQKVIECFKKYLKKDGVSVSKLEFEQNLKNKLNDPIFLEDVNPLLTLSAKKSFNFILANEILQQKLIERL